MAILHHSYIDNLSDSEYRTQTKVENKVSKYQRNKYSMGMYHMPIFLAIVYMGI